jgi:anti-sigma factor RsiW
LEEVLAAHIRSLEVDHLTDVVSSDQHVVKPWFQGKLSYSLSVRDLAAEGAPLAGGRLDFLDGQPVAALVYRVRAHAVNVFVWPAAPGASDRPPGVVHRRGYALVGWTSHGTNGWAVSDVAEPELLALIERLRAE